MSHPRERYRNTGMDPSDSVVGSLAVGVYRFDRFHGGWTWSPEMYAIHGLDSASAVPSLELMLGLQDNSDKQRTLDGINASMRNGVPFGSEFRIVRRDGVVRTVVVVGEGRSDCEGLATMHGYLIDVTDSPLVERDRVVELENTWLHSELGQARAMLARLHEQWHPDGRSPEHSSHEPDTDVGHDVASGSRTSARQGRSHGRIGGSEPSS